MKFLFITKTSWNEPPRARHQLAFALAAKGHTVNFVSLSKTGAPFLSSSLIGAGLTLFTPSWFIPAKVVYRIPVINETYQIWLFRKLKQKFSDCIVINFDPSATLLKYFFSEYIFYCNDNFVDSKRAGNILTKLYFYLSVQVVARRALMCIAVSVFLKQNLSKYNRHSFLILTGAEKVQKLERFSEEKNPEIIDIVYVGWLSKIAPGWILALMIDPRIRVSLVGPGSELPQLRCLKKYERIIFHGEKLEKELWSVVSSANVCIAPYSGGKDTELVYTVPNKFWLYLSCGKPVVCCNIKNLFSFPEGFVYQAKDQAEFLAQVINSYENDSENHYNKRLEFIKNNCWDARVDELIKLYTKMKHE